MKPKLFNTLKLRCPYCGIHRLQKGGSWIEFDTGCPNCKFRYIREPGYFTGSTMMINYTFAVTSGILGALFAIFCLEWSGIKIATLASSTAIIGGFALFPWGNAIWMYLDHLLHPLQQDELTFENNGNS